jgi:LysM repeat protein
MQKLKLTFFLSFLVIGYAAFSQNSIYIKDYIAKYSQIAIEEMQRTGVPASITLAQGIHESEAGRSNLVSRSNNHFGIKCKSDWKGESVSHDDDARGECFRKYDSPFDSYRDHSDFLKNRSHYAFLFDLDPADFEAWAHGLKKAGYATNPKYPQLLIKLIRDYNLNDYSLIALGKKELPQTQEVFAVARTQEEAAPKIGEYVSVKVSDYPQGVFKINRSKVILVTKGTSYLAIAQDHNVPLSRLFEFNDMQPAELAEKDHLLFLQRKRKTGDKELHKVLEGESMHDIAQAEGIRLESLIEYNLLTEGQQPMPGEELYLHKQAPQAPKIISNKIVGALAKVVKSSKNEEGTVSKTTLHTVQPKETLFSISKKYAVTVDEIKEWNNLEGNTLKTGQQLRINTKANANN